MYRFRYLIPLLFLVTGCYNSTPPPLAVTGVSNPVISLNGRWEVNLRPDGEYWTPGQSEGTWQPVKVPGECMMQGYAIRHDEPFIYRKTVLIPEDYDGKTIRLRFDGVYNYARLWVNGHFVRDHHGGFTRWESDITPFVTPGKEALLILEVTDRADDISYGSGYAKHMIGGILRDVTLRALPEVFPEMITIITDLDGDYKNADLIISGRFDSIPEKNSKVSIRLTDPYNRGIPLKQDEMVIADSGAFTIHNVMRSPRKWDAEHPNLYELTLSFLEKGQLIYFNTYRIGFREVEVRGNRMLVNGKEVKLRGACRHDIHPLLGRVSTPEYEKRDVRLAKEANFNFIRTSHYPPTENFLALCDEYGLYVEDETAVCFVGSHRTKAYYPGASESDTAFTARYLSQLEEMVFNHRNHPSVICWSIGNENSFGANFKLSYDWVKTTDPTRPVIFSYPGFVPDSIRAFDILSMHYPGIDGSMEQIGKVTTAFGYADMPVIFDEWAHVACYNNFTLKEDPNIRDFWGRSLDSMWTRVFEADGGLGGAIWGMIDETFMVPDTLPGFNDWWGLIDPNVIPAEYAGHTIGYGEWGIFDTWRRKKPEFWNTKKAYSPFKVLQTKFPSLTGEGILEVPVYNRFDHTNFTELKIRYSHKGKHRVAKNIDLPPHTKGILPLQLENQASGEPVFLEVRDGRGRLIDQYLLTFHDDQKNTVRPQAPGTISCQDQGLTLAIYCSGNTRLEFNKSDGMLKSVRKGIDSLELRGPLPNLRTRGEGVIYSYHRIKEYTGWALSEFSREEYADSIVLHATGMCADSLPLAMDMVIFPDASMDIRYHLGGIPDEYIRELGVRFELENSITSIAWERDGYWSYYPNDHLSSASGSAALYPDALKAYRAIPPRDWAFDTKSFYYDGTVNEDPHSRLINRAKSTKENIREYSLLRHGLKIATLAGDGNVHCRLSKTGDSLGLFISNEMDYVDLSWGNYQRNLMLSGGYSGKVSVYLFRN